MDFVEQRMQRLAELQRQRPQFTELLSFYESLYRFFQQQACAPPWLQLHPQSSDPAGPQDRPLLAADTLQFEPHRLSAFVAGLLELLQQHGQQGQTDLQRMSQALEGHQLDLPPLLQASFERRREPLVTAAENLRIEPAILAYVLDTTLSFALRSAVEADPPRPAENWQKGVCPVCGGLPTVGEISGEEGMRQLHCGNCGTSWRFPRQICPFCGDQDKRDKEYFTAGDERGYRVDLCRACNCYLKIVDSRELGQGLPMDIEDVATLYLDILAQREGFTQGKVAVG